MHAIGGVVRVVRVSSIIETDPVDAPPPRFLNMVLTGYTFLSPELLLDVLLEIETRLGRVRRKRNDPRVIDIDLIVHGGHRVRTKRLVLPHPRARERQFVMQPLWEIWPSAFPWPHPLPPSRARA